jgi:membrane fusion protein (multidrug efflux system)
MSEQAQRAATEDPQPTPPRQQQPAQAQQPPQQAPEQQPQQPKKGGPRRRVIVLSVLAVAAVIGVAYFLYSRRYEDTDDAQIDANISNIGARVSGTVTHVYVSENQRVQAGDVLAEIDHTDLDVELAQAKAAVAQASAQLEAEDPTVQITQASNAAALTNASSDIESATAALSGAEKDVEQLVARLAEAEANDRNAQLDKQRGQELFKENAIPKAELDRRENAAVASAAAAEGARHQLAGARARVSQQRAQLTSTKGRFVEVRTNAPRQVESRKASVLYRQANLELAKAQEQQATLNLGYARIRTPVAGVVARKAVNVGDHVAPGQLLAAVAQIDHVWVTANFRETQLERMRDGQTVSVHVDALDRGFSGVIESLGGATGSRLSVLPPENASGNFVKVVQRIPVRIRLDPGQEGLERLRPGMSVEPKVLVEP